MPLVLAGATSGQATVQATDAQTVTLTLPATSGTLVTTGGAQTIEFADGSASAPSITNSGDTNTGIFFPAADTIAFTEGGTESMRIDSSGSLVVGATSNPGDLFKIVAAGTDNNNLIGSYNTAAGNAGLRIQANQAGLYLQGFGTVDPMFIVNSSATGRIVFSPSSDTERMRITSAGQLFINKTTNSADGKLEIAGNASNTNIFSSQDTTSSVDHVIFSNSNGTVGTIKTSASATSYNTSSDYRLKENIAPMTDALAQVALLKPCTYTWKSDGSDGQGFIAHELQAVVPDAVSGKKDAVETYTDEDGNEQTRIKPQGVDTSFLVATLTAAIQEQQQIITDLKARIETLENT
jgi:hypothetical protein